MEEAPPHMHFWKLILISFSSNSNYDDDKSFQSFLYIFLMLFVIMLTFETEFKPYNLIAIYTTSCIFSFDECKGLLSFSLNKIKLHTDFVYFKKGLF